MQAKSTKNNKKMGSLVITRLPGRSVQIGDEITITILETNRHTGARLRISAPREMDITRFFKSGMNRQD